MLHEVLKDYRLPKPMQWKMKVVPTNVFRSGPDDKRRVKVQGLDQGGKLQ